MTFCGVPKITLERTKEDWLKLVKIAELARYLSYSESEPYIIAFIPNIFTIILETANLNKVKIGIKRIHKLLKGRMNTTLNIK